MHSDGPAQIETRIREAELLEGGMVYLDASAWNALADHPECERLIAALRQRPAVVLGSVIAAGEILKTTRSIERRRQLSEVMRLLLGDGERPLLEPPLTVAKAAAEAFLRGDGDVLLQQTGPGRTLLGFLSQPDVVDVPTLKAWLGNLEDNLEQFRVQVEPDEPSSTRFYAPAILGSDKFLELLLDLSPTVELGLTLPQVRSLCARTDIWRALAGTLAAVITQVISHAPKRRNGCQKRPGAADLLQAVYLGCVAVFVTGDVRQLEAVSEVSAVLRHPRCVVLASEFLAGLSALAASSHACPVCGCSLRVSSAGAVVAGVHALVA